MAAIPKERNKKKESQTLGLYNLKPSFGAHKKRKRIGRGNASGHGTYSGKGQKGQNARSGTNRTYAGKKYPHFIDRLPKIGGFRSLKAKNQIVNLKDLEKYFKENEVVTPKALKKVGLVTDSKRVKILGEGRLTKKLRVEAQAFSRTAVKSIEEAGGQIKVLNFNKK